MIQSFNPKGCDSLVSIVDSMPIVTCKGKKQKGKVAAETTSKGFCSTKNMFYYSMEPHAIGQRRERDNTFSGDTDHNTHFEKQLGRIQKRMCPIASRKDHFCR